MRPLQEPPISAAPASAGAAAGPRGVRCVIGVVGGVLWWGGLLWVLLRPALAPGAAAAASWPGWVAAGGWGLGLIPLHAVPAYARRAQGPSGTGPRWQRGHQ